MTRDEDGAWVQAGQPIEEPILQFFGYSHLPAYLQDVSKRFHDLAIWIASESPPCEERCFALRKLLEAKDCAVRAKIHGA